MQDFDECEEGEISDDPSSEIIQPYIALERPATSFVPNQFKQQLSQLSDDSLESSSSEESTSDDDRPAKRRKKTFSSKRLLHKTAPVKQNPWSSVLLEDHIESELKDISVKRSKTLQERTRDVESYDYSLVLHDRLDNDDIDEESEKKIRKKLEALDQNDGGESFAAENDNPPENFEDILKKTKVLITNSRKRKMDQRNPTRGRRTPVPKTPQRVDDLIATVESTDFEIAKEIASKLHEDKIDLILRVVELLGKEMAIQLFESTKEAENDGGIMVANGSRRRTPGGVFLHLLRNHDEIPMEKIRQVFSEEERAREKFKRVIRAKRRQENATNLKKVILPEVADLPTRGELEMAMASRTDRVETAEQPEMNSEDIVCDWQQKE